MGNAGLNSYPGAGASLLRKTVSVPFRCINSAQSLLLEL